jgi:hypothetical protein
LTRIEAGIEKLQNIRAVPRFSRSIGIVDASNEEQTNLPVKVDLIKAAFDLWGNASSKIRFTIWDDHITPFSGKVFFTRCCSWIVTAHIRRANHKSKIPTQIDRWRSTPISDGQNYTRDPLTLEISAERSMNWADPGSFHLQRFAHYVPLLSGINAIDGDSAESKNGDDSSQEEPFVSPNRRPLVFVFGSVTALCFVSVGFGFIYSIAGIEEKPIAKLSKVALGIGFLVAGRMVIHAGFDILYSGPVQRRHLL